MKLDFKHAYEMGRDSAMRKNKSGCCCKFDENDEIVELCYAHKLYFEDIIKKLKEVRQLGGSGSGGGVDD